MKFGSHPINLSLRFILELTALFGAGYWGWTKHSGVLQYFLLIGLPLLMATIWGIFAVPNDPSRSGKTVVVTSGGIRLIIEWAIFGLGGWFLFKSGFHQLSFLFIGFVLVHYILSIDRIKWLIRQ